MKTIGTEELKEKLDNNEVTLIEVLEEEEYNKSHIKGAINIPLKKISFEARKKFDKDDNLVVYCSDEDCTASPTAAKKLNDSGFKNVWDYEGGKKAWKEAGLPME
jgi:rhodanese-related sulfurtransferase